MEALPSEGLGAGRFHPGDWSKRGDNRLLNHSLRTRRALLLAGGCCSALIAAALPSEALAQTAPQPPADTTPAPGDVNTIPPKEPGAIVITGIRHSIHDSIEIKRRERSVVEAVSAEDIGKLPDVSIAESI